MNQHCFDLLAVKQLDCCLFCYQRLLTCFGGENVLFSRLFCEFLFCSHFSKGAFALPFLLFICYLFIIFLFCRCDFCFSLQHVNWQHCDYMWRGRFFQHIYVFLFT